jgi:hypothetical protein
VRRLGLLLVLSAAASAGCAKREFHLSGTVTIASVLQRKAPRDNAVMFIIAKNRGDVPVAVHRIVNPRFPVKFTLGPEDLIVPDLPSDTALSIEVEMNTHGAAGKPVRGDLEGVHLNPVYPGDRRIHIVVDRQI